MAGSSPATDRGCAVGRRGRAGSDGVSAHPVAPVPEHLFDDEREQRWRARYTAPRMSRPGWARDAPDRCLYTSNASGTTEVYVWDRATDLHRQRHRPAQRHLRRHPRRPTASRCGGSPTPTATSTATGSPSRSRAATTSPRSPASRTGTPRAWTSGARSSPRARPPTRAPGSGCAAATAPPQVIYANAEDAGVGGLSEDETLLAIGHSEHGDSRHPDVRVVRVADGSTVAEKSDGPGKGLTPLGFAPVPGDPRLLLLHERRGREELLIWDVDADTETEIHLDLPGEVAADWSPDATFLLVWHTHAARTRLLPLRPRPATLTELPVAPGCVGSAQVRPDGTVEYTCSSAAEPPSVRALHPGRHRPRARRAARRARAGLGARRGPRGRPGTSTRSSRGQATAPGPRCSACTAARTPPTRTASARPARPGSTRASPSSRSTTAARRATARPGATRSRAAPGSPSWRTSPRWSTTASPRASPTRRAASSRAGRGAATSRCWRWARSRSGGRRASRACRWPTTSPPTPTRWSSCGRSTGRCSAARRRRGPEVYRAASPLTYVDAVRAPVLVLAGENDPRCPIRQIDNYLDALAARGADYAVSRFDAGHGSLVVEQTMAPHGDRGRLRPRQAALTHTGRGPTHTSRTVRQPHPACASAPPPHRYARLVVLWRVHVELEDRPGRLGELATAVGRAGCNIISLHVVGRARRRRLGDRRAARAGAVGERPGRARRRDPAARASPARCWCARTRCELADPATTALALARMVVAEPGSAPSAVATMLRARLVDPAAESARRLTSTRCGSATAQVRLGRAWPFTATELSRAAALLELAAQLAMRVPAEPRATGRSCCCATARRCGCAWPSAADALLVGALHARCSPAARRSRFLSPTPRLGPGELDALLGGPARRVARA